MAVIEVEALHKEFRRLRGGRTIAVDGLDLAVPYGGVFGFLGPNGAGKTTTIRCALGLVKPTAGRTRVLDAEANRLHTVIDRIGSIVETPTFFPTFSGRRNLRLLGRVDGIGAAAVEQVLERVGLAERGDDIFKNYSLGMKQRLGIAAALLREPELLILDEPANGLDPAGIKEVRQLLRSLADEGRTVFLSSHLLGEVQQICDRVAILARGKCIAQGEVADVLSRGQAARMVVKVENIDGALQVLTGAGFDANVERDEILVTAPASDGARISRTLALKRIYVAELRPMEVSLEDVFLQLTEGGS
ncbi:MAG: ATP-binding cassette domain-containing protein [Actinobacteria bacterium]|nr:MAG: ATP-binding cassette domain-containing protein [Actinomycetota bacterium]